ncbi:MAG: M28 family peptidase [Planctomycetales bacterium]|nr:M28 family peptidase [Planctomycetales bacterium]
MRFRALAFALPPAALLAAAVVTAHAGPGGDDYSPELKAAVNAVSEKQLREFVMMFASDQFEGREAGLPSGWRAADFLVAHHRKCGTKPLGTDGSYLQPFPLGKGGGGKGPVEEANVLSIADAKGKRMNLPLRASFIPYKFSGEGAVEGEILFAGYGISAPDHGYDDYAGVDAKGKLVVVLDKFPRAGGDSPFSAAPASDHVPVRKKAETAKAKGAVALLVAADPRFPPAKMSTESDVVWPPPVGEVTIGFPVAYCSAETVELLLAPKKPSDLGKAVDKALAPQSFLVKGKTASLEIRKEGKPRGIGRNVVALYEASATDALDEYIVVGAHYDHVGLGHFGSKGKKGEIHNGADDNASGTTGLSEVARVLCEKKPKFRRHIILIHFDGEEKGLLGSQHYVSAPLVPIEKTVAMFNIDMIGRGKPNEMLCGPEEDKRNPTFQKILAKLAARFGVNLPGKGMGQYMHRSDQASFMQKGIPVLFLFGGDHSDYHTQNDDPEKLLIGKMKTITQLILLLASETADLPQKP